MVRINFRKIGRRARHITARVSRIGVNAFNAVPTAGEAIAGASARVMDEFQARTHSSLSPLYHSYLPHRLARD